MAVTAISIDQIVAVLIEQRRGAYRDRLLSAVKVTEPADLLAGLGVFLIGSFLEPADKHHHPQSFTLNASVVRDGFLNGRTLLYLYGH
jgi:hypothetical protein